MSRWRRTATARIAKLAFLLAGLGFFALLASGPPVSRASTTQSILLTSASEDYLSGSIDELIAAGFTATSSLAQAEQLIGPNTRAFIVTRGAFASVPADLWQRLYDSGIVVGGLDVSLHELQPLARPGRVAGWGRLRYTPTRPIFSLMYRSGCTGSGGFSDWMKNWNIAAVVQQKERYAAPVPTSQNCPEVPEGPLTP